MDADGEVPEDLVGDARPTRENAQQIVFIETKSKVPRELHIKRRTLMSMGAPRGVGGLFQCVQGVSLAAPQ